MFCGLASLHAIPLLWIQQSDRERDTVVVYNGNYPQICGFIDEIILLTNAFLHTKAKKQNKISQSRDKRIVAYYLTTGTTYSHDSML